MGVLAHYVPCRPVPARECLVMALAAFIVLWAYVAFHAAVEPLRSCLNSAG